MFTFCYVGVIHKISEYAYQKYELNMAAVRLMEECKATLAMNINAYKRHLLLLGGCVLHCGTSPPSLTDYQRVISTISDIIPRQNLPVVLPSIPCCN